MEVLEREKLKKVKVTEPDSRLMKDSRGVIQPSHSGQIAVDDKDLKRWAEQKREGKQIYKKRAYTVEPAFGEMKWDGRKPSMELRGLVKVRGEFSLMCLVHNVKKIVKRVLDGTVSLPGKYNKLIEEAVLG